MSASPSAPPTPHAPGSLRELLAVAVPLAVSTGSVSVAQVVDRVCLGWYDGDALAAAMPAGALHWALVAPFLGVAMTAGTFVAQHTAAGEPGQAAAAVWQSVWVAGAAALVFLLAVPLAGPVFALAGHPPGVRQYEVVYFTGLCVGGGPMVASFALSEWFGGRGETTTVMGVNLALAAVNILLTPPLVFGWGPVPECGAAGAAAATVTAFCVACGLYLFLLARGPAKAAGFYEAWRFDPAAARRLLRFGVPTGLGLLADVGAITVFLLLVGRLGAGPLAGSTLAFNLNSLCFLPAVGLGTATSILVGHRVGEGRAGLAARSAWLALAVGGAAMTVAGLVFLLVPDALVKAYVGDGSGFDPAGLDFLYDTAPVLLRFVAVYCLFDVLSLVCGGAVRGAGDTLFPFAWTTLCAWALMVAPAAWVVTRPGYLEDPAAGVAAAWACCTLYIVVCGTGMLGRFLGGKWKTMTVREGPASMEEPAPTLEPPAGRD